MTSTTPDPVATPPLLTIEYKITKPVELTDLTSSLVAINNHYKRFVESNLIQFEAKKGEPRLYIREMRHGSIIADLIDTAWKVIPIVTGINSLYEFAENLKRIIDYYMGKSEVQPTLTAQELKEVAQIVEPIANDNSSQMNISTTIHGDVHVHVNFNSNDGNAIQGRVNRQIEEMKEPNSLTHKGVALYWYQARGGEIHSTPAGDKAIIESISKKPVKVFFTDENLREAMIRSEENPFKHFYVVDVQVETVADSPVLYNVINMHQKVERPDINTLPPAS